VNPLQASEVARDQERRALEELRRRLAEVVVDWSLDPFDEPRPAEENGTP
jgi:hypothetical protein